MANYTWRAVESRRYEYEVPVPPLGAPFADIGVAYAGICHRFQEVNGRAVTYDDDIRIECGDDCIRLFFIDNQPGPDVKEEITRIAVKGSAKKRPKSA